MNPLLGKTTIFYGTELAHTPSSSRHDIPGIKLDTLLSAAAVLLGFQITTMGLRLQAELQKSRHDIMSLNCSDALNIAGMLTTVIPFVPPTLATCNAQTEGCVAVGVILSGAFALS